MTTHYDVLGVPEDASPEEIEEAYRELVKREHPDQSDHPNAMQRFIRIKEAYDVLSDSSMRSRYDRSDGEEFVADDRDRTTEGDGWRAYTRRRPEADVIWGQNQDTSADPAPAPNTKGEPIATRVVAYTLTTIPIILGVIFLLQLVLAEFSGDPPPSDVPVLPAVVIFVIGFVLAIVVAESILDTDRRLQDVV